MFPTIAAEYVALHAGPLPEPVTMEMASKVTMVEDGVDYRTVCFVDGSSVTFE